MANRVDLSEVIEFADDFYAYVNRLLSQLDNVKSKVNSVINMDSFKGESADKAKESLNSFHIEMLSNFENLMIDLIDNVDNHINKFLSEVDSSEDAIIKSNYLDEQDELIQEEFMELVNLSSDVKQTINGVSDITSATPPSFSNVVDDKASTARIIIDVNNDLSSFVSTGRNRINS
ncbi:T7SS effector LXG polymorphic toxin, partial [Gracilibacillus boraciitolerans]|uniref:T7SS effector LXG polymorphic toxin n=1 Tax=Gracilibacillus boraciitolerans TaxID=307521 RepID=UPI00054F2421